MAKKDTTIIYITDNSLDKNIMELCQKYLAFAAVDIPIISVSQEPLKFGDNICIGKMDRCGLTIDKQIKAGLDRVDTQYVAIAEHDCLYTHEHFTFIPPDKKHFWYNDNCWLLQYRNIKYPQYDGMFSYIKRRRVQSQLICGTDSLRECIDRKIEILSDPVWFTHCPAGRVGEPGTNHYNRTKRLAKKVGAMHLWGKLKQYIIDYNAKDWRTKLPNIDIRHGTNFTGQRRGKKRTYSLPYWGELKNIIEGSHCYA